MINEAEDTNCANCREGKFGTDGGVRAGSSPHHVEERLKVEGDPSLSLRTGEGGRPVRRSSKSEEGRPAIG